MSPESEGCASGDGDSEDRKLQLAHGVLAHFSIYELEEKGTDA